MRVDAAAEFFVRVSGTLALVAAAARTLGRRTLQPDGLRELLEGKFIGSLRTVAAQMTPEEMHEQCSAYARRVRATASDSLVLNGLEPESVAIVDLDRTSLDFFNPSNAFDAEGLTALTQRHRDPAQAAQHDRTADAGRYPQPEPRHAAAGPADRRQWRICTDGAAARGGNSPRRTTAGPDPRTRVVRSGGRAGATGRARRWTSAGWRRPLR
jgi:hypothetical protein